MLKRSLALTAKSIACRYNQTGKVQLHFVGNSNGLVYLQKADATVEFIENVEVEKEVPDDDSTDTGTLQFSSMLYGYSSLGLYFADIAHHENAVS